MESIRLSGNHQKPVNGEAGKKYSTTTKVDDTLAPGTSYVKTRGTDGSTIEVTRTVRDVNGNIVRQDLFASVYDPINEVILKGRIEAGGLLHI